MKVKELIKELEKCNPESDLICYSLGDKDSSFINCKEFCNVNFGGYDKEDIQEELKFEYNMRDAKRNCYVYIEIGGK